MGLRSFYFILGAVFFFSCGTAAIKFPYKFFHISPIAAWNHPSGKLLGAQEQDDRALKDCSPVKNSEGKLVQRCVVVFYTELNKLVTDYKQTKQEVIDLQKRCGK